MTALGLIALGGAVGALLRWWVSSRDEHIPWGVMAVNVLASGLVALTASLSGSLHWLVNVGLLGALSTWSSLAVAVVHLWRRDRFSASAVLIGTVTASVGSAWLLL